MCFYVCTCSYNIRWSKPTNINRENHSIHQITGRNSGGRTEEGLYLRLEKNRVPGILVSASQKRLSSLVDTQSQQFPRSIPAVTTTGKTKQSADSNAGGRYAILTFCFGPGCNWLSSLILFRNPGLDADSLMKAGSLRYQMARSWLSTGSSSVVVSHVLCQTTPRNDAAEQERNTDCFFPPETSHL